MIRTLLLLLFQTSALVRSLDIIWIVERSKKYSVTTNVECLFIFIFGATPDVAEAESLGANRSISTHSLEVLRTKRGVTKYLQA